MRARGQTAHGMNATVLRLSVLLWIAGIVMCASLWAKTGPTITIQMLDSKTGRPITTSDFQVWLDHATGPDFQWVRVDRNGIGEVTLPQGAALITVGAQYGNEAFFYIDCDSDKDYKMKWYPIAKIVASGFVVPNYCSKKKAVAKPGELIIFVRPQTWWEKMQR